MAREKYNPKTFPRLAKGYAMRGLTDEQISEKLGISRGTLYNYVKKYSDFATALEEGKEPVDMDIEMALLNRAKGYEYIETKQTIAGDKVVQSERTLKHIPAHPDSMKFWLINRLPERWSMKQEIKMEKIEKLSDEDLDALAEKIISGDS